jgi:ubiquinone/menaquinone biosynthesis C-methylase UbiE
VSTKDRPEDQNELFRRLAAGYDQAIRRYQVAYDAMLALSTDLARIAAPGRSRCLDFGAGTGAALPLLAGAFDEVVAIEPAKPMLELARARVTSGIPGTTAGQVSFIEGTIQSSEAKALADASFDAVHCSLVLMFVATDADKLEVLEFFRRILRVHGSVVVTDIVIAADAYVGETCMELWKDIMRYRGADDEFVAAAERQVHATMHRRTPAQLVALLEEAGFREIEQPFNALHTTMVVAKK